ncbi:MAG: LytTR family DNA-binding domain-containing protein [Bacteroidia bacterium]|nr:LytTR family DNA-binding domain-containing protein [Bacteroidia bacterium]
MDKIRTLLVDDEYLALKLLGEYSKNIPELEIVDRVKSPIKALDILNKQTVDLLFLDIQMPTLSGNNLLKTLKNPPLVIFTTAYSEYALEAFDLNAIDYLLKPFSFERFLQAVNKAKEQHYLRYQEKTSPAPAPIPSPNKDYFSVKADGKIVKVFFEDILFIEGLKEYVRLICKDQRLVTLESLKKLEEILPSEEFIRVHKSYIVARKRVKSLDGNMLEIGQHKIPISRSKKEEIVEWIFFQ